MGEKLRALLGQRAVHLEARVRPCPDPFAVMQIRLRRRAIPRVCFVITAAGAERPRPAAGAIGLVIDVMRLQEPGLTAVIDTGEHGAQLVLVGAREAMTERDVSVGRDAEQAESGATRMRLAHALVDFLERVAHIREAMPPARERRPEILAGERLESGEQLLKALILDRVFALP